MDISISGISAHTMEFALGSFVPVINSTLSSTCGMIRNDVKLLGSKVKVVIVLSIAVIFVPIVLRKMV